MATGVRWGNTEQEIIKKRYLQQRVIRPEFGSRHRAASMLIQRLYHREDHPSHTVRSSYFCVLFRQNLTSVPRSPERRHTEFWLKEGIRSEEHASNEVAFAQDTSLTSTPTPPLPLHCLWRPLKTLVWWLLLYYERAPGHCHFSLVPGRVMEPSWASSSRPIPAALGTVNQQCRGRGLRWEVHRHF